MANVLLFVEDDAQERTIGSLVRRVAAELRVSVEIESRTALGGFARVQSELHRFVLDLQSGRQTLPDLLVVARDANCRGQNPTRRELQQVAVGCPVAIAYAVPDPHVERWLLLDSGAFRVVFGRGCDAPDQKCERDRYKQLLSDAVEATGITPPLGGIEYADRIVAEMDLQSVAQRDVSFRRAIDELRSQFLGLRG